jgi:signal transduction histidine kinase/DNA-binding response OmpR family regulator
MDLAAFKVNFLLQEERCQVIFFDKDGYLVDTCDTLMPLSRYKNSFTRIPLPIIDHIQDVLKEIAEREQLVFPRVEVEFAGYPTQILDFILIKYHNEQGVCFVCVIRDYVVRYHHLQEIVTEQRTAAMEKELLEIKHSKIALENELVRLKNEELEVAKAIKNDFFAKASHELRTPVNGILGLTEMLSKIASGEQKEYLDALSQVANQLKIVVNDLLDLSKLEEKKITFESANFQLQEVFNHIHLAFAPLVKGKKLNISFSVAPEMPTYLKGDSTRIAQIIYNLVGNSLKFTKEGEINISAEISKIIEDKKQYLLKFTIKDTGIGIAPDKLAQIFEPYTQETDETYRIYGGTGLGLAIVKQLVEAMQGEISVESIQQQGTTFSFTIPLLVGETPLPSPQEIPTTPSYQHYRVLIADDNDINLMIITKKMQEIGFEIDTAQNGQEALGSLASKKYDIVFLDIDMPLLDGYQTTAQIRAIKEDYYQQIPIFLMTAYSYADVKEKIENIGVSDFLTKPFEMHLLLKKLQKHLINPKPKSAQINLNVAQLNEFTQGDEKFEKELLQKVIETLHTFKTEYAQAIWQSDVEKSIHHLLHKYHMIFTIFSDSNFSQEIKNTTNAIWSSDNQDLERERLKIHIHQFSDEMIAQLQARISAK